MHMAYTYIHLIKRSFNYKHSQYITNILDVQQAILSHVLFLRIQKNEKIY